MYEMIASGTTWDMVLSTSQLLLLPWNSWRFYKISSGKVFKPRGGPSIPRKSAKLHGQKSRYRHTIPVPGILEMTIFLHILYISCMAIEFVYSLFRARRDISGGFSTTILPVTNWSFCQCYWIHQGTGRIQIPTLLWFLVTWYFPGLWGRICKTE